MSPVNPLATLFNLGGTELLVILLIVLLLFGAKKLPELARGLGQAFREFGRAREDIEREIARASDAAGTAAGGGPVVRKPAQLEEHRPEVEVAVERPGGVDRAGEDVSGGADKAGGEAGSAQRPG